MTNTSMINLFNQVILSGWSPQQFYQDNLTYFAYWTTYWTGPYMVLQKCHTVLMYKYKIQCYKEQNRVRVIA